MHIQKNATISRGSRIYYIFLKCSSLDSDGKQLLGWLTAHLLEMVHSQLYKLPSYSKTSVGFRLCNGRKSSIYSNIIYGFMYVVYVNEDLTAWKAHTDNDNTRRKNQSLKCLIYDKDIFRRPAVSNRIYKLLTVFIQSLWSMISSLTCTECILGWGGRRRSTSHLDSICVYSSNFNQTFKRPMPVKCCHVLL